MSPADELNTDLEETRELLTAPGTPGCRRRYSLPFFVVEVAHQLTWLKWLAGCSLYVRGG